MSLNLKTYVHKFTVYPYLYGHAVFKKDEILDLLIIGLQPQKTQLCQRMTCNF